jgi:hypothetical protein
MVLLDLAGTLYICTSLAKQAIAAAVLVRAAAVNGRPACKPPTRTNSVQKV